MQETRSDIVVIGAGPIGLELAVALKRNGVDYVHFDAKQIGYTISWFPPQTRFFSSNERIAIAGVPLQTPDQFKATREEYLAYLRSVVLQFDLKIETYCPVVGIERVGKEFLVTVEPPAGRRRVRCNRIALCTGGTDHPRRLNAAGEDLPHVSHYFRDPHTYFQKRLLVVGGKNSAVETALRCHHAGAKVALCYRRSQLDSRSIKYWLLPEINGLIQEKRIDAHFESQPIEITPSQVRLRRSSGEEVTIVSDFVLLQIGYEQDTTLLELAGIELTGSCRTPTFDPSTMETNVAGIYVAGTAVGGTQEKYHVFIENCHMHVDRILAAITGATAPPAPAPLTAPET
jgi:thioredoxin reductase (NADPH)